MSPTSVGTHGSAPLSVKQVAAAVYEALIHRLTAVTGEKRQQLTSFDRRRETVSQKWISTTNQCDQWSRTLLVASAKALGGGELFAVVCGDGEVFFAECPDSWDRRLLRAS